MRTKAAARQNEALCARYGATATRRDTPLNPRSLTVDGIGRDFEDPPRADVEVGRQLAVINVFSGVNPLQLLGVFPYGKT